ncbi:MAG: hypothetical protein PHR03_02880 [Desulfovibrionales bacterium]|nr:hypothetical protein [Desulfovibrionales bacterium]
MNIFKRETIETRDYESELQEARAQARRCESILSAIAAPMFVTGRDLAGCQGREDAI